VLPLGAGDGDSVPPGAAVATSLKRAPDANAATNSSPDSSSPNEAICSALSSFSVARQLPPVTR
jgi:hypothetical protein